MTSTADRVRKMPTLEKIAYYWVDAAPAVFPNLNARIVGWGEPSCFRCGWLAPIPEPSSARPWLKAAGWLERAHLQDHALDGPDVPENLVPLCPLCHSVMPSFTDPARAIEWVKQGQPLTCAWWWQWATDGQYGGEQYGPYPGFSAFRRYYLFAADHFRQVESNAKNITSPGSATVSTPPGFAGAGTAPSDVAAGTKSPRTVPAAT